MSLITDLLPPTAFQPLDSRTHRSPLIMVECRPRWIHPSDITRDDDGQMELLWQHFVLSWRMAKELKPRTRLQLVSAVT